jgi:hypothetical protein
VPTADGVADDSSDAEGDGVLDRVAALEGSDVED